MPIFLHADMIEIDNAIFFFSDLGIQVNPQLYSVTCQ